MALQVHARIPSIVEGGMTMKLTRFIRALPILAALAVAGAMVAPKPAEARIGVGVFVCPLDKANPVGRPCACPAYGGASVAGTVR